MAERILHISADYPDCLDTAKPLVVKSLLELTQGEFDHRVISINRQTPAAPKFFRESLLSGLRPRARCEFEDCDDVTAVRYFAPAKGLFHKRMLLGLADQIVTRLKGEPIPSLVLGHKLSVEGFIAERVAEQIGAPFGVAIQGNTDTRILAARPDLASDLGRLFRQAAVVMPFAPWALGHFERRFGGRAGPTYTLPCPTQLDEPLVPKIGRGGRFVTAFHLRNHRLKNLSGMVRAMRVLHEQGREFTLDIIGGGEARERADCGATIGATAGIEMLGHVPPPQLPAIFNAATGLVLPSRRESFGLVFIEALFAGLPVIYPQGAAIDGYFDNAPFAIAVDAQDPANIAAAMTILSDKEAEIKTDLRDWQSSEDAQRFTRKAIGAQFTRAIQHGLAR